MTTKKLMRGWSLKIAREKRGYSQQEFASVLNVSPSLLCMMESGKRNIPIDIWVTACLRLCKPNMLHSWCEGCPIAAAIETPRTVKKAA